MTEPFFWVSCRQTACSQACAGQAWRFWRYFTCPCMVCMAGRLVVGFLDSGGCLLVIVEPRLFYNVPALSGNAALSYAAGD